MSATPAEDNAMSTTPAGDITTTAGTRPTPDSATAHILRSIQGWQEQSGFADIAPLGKKVARYVGDPKKLQRFHCLVIAAYRGDGITSAADQAVRAAHQAGVAEIARLNGDDSPRLAVADVLGERTVLRLARRAGVEPQGTVGRWSVLGVLGVVAVLVLAAVVYLVDKVFAGDATPTWKSVGQTLTEPRVLLVALVTGLAAIVGGELGGLGQRRPGERLEHLAKSLQNPNKASLRNPNEASLRNPNEAARERFVGLLAGALIADRRRCLVVDDADRLDTTSKAVLRQALLAMPTQENRLWIVFESGRPALDNEQRQGEQRQGEQRQVEKEGIGVLLGGLGAFVVGARAGNPSGGPTEQVLRSSTTLLFELVPLTAKERDTLVAGARAGTPNPAYFVVKDILGGSAHEAEKAAFIAAWPPAEVGTELHDALVLLYLLSVSAPRGRVVTFPLRDLPEDLSARLPRREVLQSVLGTLPTLDTLRRRLAGATGLFAEYIVEDRRTRPVLLRLSPAVQDVLAERAGAYRLPRAGLVHLFWALYRDGRLGAEPSWLAAQVRHLREADAPAPERSAEVHEQFAGALLAVIAACVGLGNPATAASLLDRAADLAAEPGFPMAPGALMTQARALFAVTADPRPMLTVSPAPQETVSHAPQETVSHAPQETVSRAQERALISVSGAPREEDLLLSLYEQVTPGAADLARLAADPAGRDVRLRAIWLAFSLQPLTGTALPASLPLTRVIGYAHRTLPVLARQALLEADDGWSAAALAGVTTALWCLALAGEDLTGPILHQIDRGLDQEDDSGIDLEATLSAGGWSEWMALVDVQVAEGLEHGLQLARRTLAVRDGYLRAATGNELLAVVVAAAVRIRLVWTGLQRARENRLDAVIREGCHDLGIRVPVERDTRRLSGTALAEIGAALGRRMHSLQVTWAALGYPAAAAVLSTRRLQFLLGLPGQAQPVARAATVERRRTGPLGVIANLAIAAYAAGHGTVRAEVVAATVARLLNGHELGGDLAAQLSLLAIALASPYNEVDTTPHLAYLVQRTDDRPAAPLAALLRRVGDDDLGVIYLRLCNAGVTDRVGPEQARSLIEALRGRLATAAEPAADAAGARLDVFRLQRAARDGTAVDPGAILGAWERRRQYAVYPFVLLLLLRRDDFRLTDPRLRQEIAAVLREPAPYRNETGIILLAVEIAGLSTETWPRTSEGIAELVAILRPVAGRVTRDSRLGLSIEKRLRQYLLWADRANTPLYRAGLFDIARAEVQFLDERRMSDLLAREQYAHLLLTFWQIFDEFLPDPRPGEAEAGAFVDRGRRILNIEFLRDLSGQDGTRTPRAAAEVRDALVRLLDNVIGVPDLPADLAALLAEHRERIRGTGGTDVSLHARP